MQVIVVDRFYKRAAELRRIFDRKFENPLKARPERFVWDFWHVPGEYTHLRTPAFHYFPKKQYEAFHQFLVKWGREHLGCHDVSPPWLSCYINGCRQEFHQDVPHGPLAFVFSLTRHYGHAFTGGETFIRRGRRRIAPLFNRLVLFNPALVHGVREVKGVMDPRQGRLVIHGWFVQPRAFWVGPLRAEDVDESIATGLRGFHLRKAVRTPGLTSFRLSISPKGTVRSLRPLVETAELAAPDRTQLHLRLTGLRFPARSSGSQLTLPIMWSL